MVTAFVATSSVARLARVDPEHLYLGREPGRARAGHQSPQHRPVRQGVPRPSAVRAHRDPRHRTGGDNRLPDPFPISELESPDLGVTCRSRRPGPVPAVARRRPLIERTVGWSTRPDGSSSSTSYASSPNTVHASTTPAVVAERVLADSREGAEETGLGGQTRCTTLATTSARHRHAGSLRAPRGGDRGVRDRQRTRRWRASERSRRGGLFRAEPLCTGAMAPAIRASVNVTAIAASCRRSLRFWRRSPFRSASRRSTPASRNTCTSAVNDPSCFWAGSTARSAAPGQLGIVVVRLVPVLHGLAPRGAHPDPCPFGLDPLADRAPWTALMRHLDHGYPRGWSWSNTSSRPTASTSITGTRDGSTSEMRTRRA